MIAAVLRNLGLVLVLLAAVPSSARSTSDNFLTSDNIRNILVSSSVIGVVTVGMTFVIIGGGIDLSVGALVALASVWATTAGDAGLRRRASWSCARCSSGSAPASSTAR